MSGVHPGFAVNAAASVSEFLTKRANLIFQGKRRSSVQDRGSWKNPKKQLG
jgi:hypothetical protein